MSKIVAVVVLILLVVAGAFWRQRYRGHSTVQSVGRKSQADPASVYLGLRNQRLQGSRAKLNLAASTTPTEPWAAVMDLGMSNGTATIVAVADGSASIYLISGGGYIGGGQGHESIRKAARNMLFVARQAQPGMRATKDFPLPGNGRVTFYVVTDAGVFTAEAPEAELRSRHTLTNLYAAGQEIITQYRLISPQ